MPDLKREVPSSPPGGGRIGTGIRTDQTIPAITYSKTAIPIFFRIPNVSFSLNRAIAFD
jgi:hypothetical protein